jgi:hypothetical protein
MPIRYGSNLIFIPNNHEPTDKTPDKEIIRFEFPDGFRYRYEIPGIKFSGYTAAGWKRRTWNSWPFCVVKLCQEVKKAKNREERRLSRPGLKLTQEDSKDERCGTIQRGV